MHAHSSPLASQVCKNANPRQKQTSSKKINVYTIQDSCLHTRWCRSLHNLLSFPPPATTATAAAAIAITATAAAAAVVLFLRSPPVLLLLLLPYWLVVGFLQLPVVFPKRFILWCTPQSACDKFQNIWLNPSS
jgi:hypothetical protein